MEPFRLSEDPVNAFGEDVAEAGACLDDWHATGIGEADPERVVTGLFGIACTAGTPAAVVTTLQPLAIRYAWLAFRVARPISVHLADLSRAAGAYFVSRAGVQVRPVPAPRGLLTDPVVRVREAIDLSLLAL